MSKPDQEPNIFITLASGLGLASMGMFLGIAYFISFPLQVYKNQTELNEAIDKKESPYLRPGDSYYFEGPVLRTKSWAPKREQLLAGEAKQLSFETGEINGWLDTYFKPVAPASAEESSGITIRPEVANVAVVDEGRMYLSLPATLDAFGWEGEFVLSASGYFKSGSPARFVVTQTNLNGARLPGFVGKLLVRRMAGAYRRTEEYGQIIQGWQQVESVELGDGALQLSLR